MLLNLHPKVRDCAVILGAGGTPLEQACFYRLICAFLPASDMK